MKGFSTKAVHAGTGPRSARPVATPIFQSSTFVSDDEVYEAMQENRARGTTIYTRYGNPTRRAVEEKVAALEGAEDALSFSSGMAAISSVMISFLGPGDHVVAGDELYGGTAALFREEMSRMGVGFTFVDATRPDAVASALRPSTRILYFESITNPLVRVPDLPALAEIAQEHKALLVVDNTFATPFNLRPLEHGAHIVIESATKYLNGHSDLVAGVAAGSQEHMDKVWRTSLHLGGTMEPLSAFLLERGLKTLGLRVQAHNRNALVVARFLEKHPKVKKVFYPGLASHPQHQLAQRLLSGFGGSLSFVVEGGDEAGLTLMRNLRIIKEATSLGGVESLVSMPFNTSHSAAAGYSREDRLALGIEPGTVRLSVGIEDPEDILEDLENALRSVSSGRARGV